jgi:hypothetical protein
MLDVVALPTGRTRDLNMGRTRDGVEESRCNCEESRCDCGGQGEGLSVEG